MTTQTLFVTKDTTITMQVNGDVAATEVQNTFEGDITMATEGDEPITDEAVDGTSEVIDSEASSYLFTGAGKFKKDSSPLWLRAAYGESETGSGAGVWQQFNGTGTALDTDFIFENVQQSTGTGAGFKVEVTDANVKLSNITMADKGIIKFNYEIKCSADNTKQFFRTEEL